MCVCWNIASLLSVFHRRPFSRRRDPLRRETTVRWREATRPAGGVTGETSLSFPASSFREIFFFYRISQWSCFALNVRDTTIKCLWFSANTTEIQGLAKPLPLFRMKRAQIVLHVSSLYLSTRSLMWHFILRGWGRCRNYFFVVVVRFVFLKDALTAAAAAVVGAWWLSKSSRKPRQTVRVAGETWMKLNEIWVLNGHWGGASVCLMTQLGILSGWLC